MPNFDREAIGDAMVDLLVEGLSKDVHRKIDDVVAKVTSPLLEELNEKLRRIEENRTIHIHMKDRVSVYEGKAHAEFPKFVKAIGTGLPVMLVGPAGTGKTFAAEQVAKAFTLDFYALSVGVQTSKTDIGGYLNAHGDYVRTQFRDAYENGGVFLMDEIDAGNSNVLIFINAALSGHFCAFPDRMVKKHENFLFVGTANTYGTGANREYVGRNKLDAATLDRFVILDWPIDVDLELSFVTGTKYGDAWANVVQSVRQKVEDAQYRLMVSPRATLKGVALLDAGIGFDHVVQSVLLATANPDQQEILKSEAERAWGRSRHMIKE